MYLFAREIQELGGRDTGCRKRNCGVLVKIVEFYPDKFDLIRLLRISYEVKVEANS